MCLKLFHRCLLIEQQYVWRGSCSGQRKGKKVLYITGKCSKSGRFQRKLECLFAVWSQENFFIWVKDSIGLETTEIYRVEFIGPHDGQIGFNMCLCMHAFTHLIHH